MNATPMLPTSKQGRICQLSAGNWQLTSRAYNISRSWSTIYADASSTFISWYYYVLLFFLFYIDIVLRKYSFNIITSIYQQTNEMHKFITCVIYCRFGKANVRLTLKEIRNFPGRVVLVQYFSLHVFIAYHKILQIHVFIKVYSMHLYIKLPDNKTSKSTLPFIDGL